MDQAGQRRIVVSAERFTDFHAPIGALDGDSSGEAGVKVAAPHHARNGGIHIDARNRTGPGNHRLDLGFGYFGSGLRHLCGPIHRWAGFIDRCNHRQMPNQGWKHIVRIDRLGNIVIHSCCQAPLAVAFERVGRQRDDWQVGEFRRFANLFGRLEAIHHWQMHVHEHDVERLAIEKLQGLTSVASDGHACADHFQQPLYHLLIDRVVLDKQDGASHQAIPVGMGHDGFGLVSMVRVEQSRDHIGNFRWHRRFGQHHVDVGAIDLVGQFLRAGNHQYDRRGGANPGTPMQHRCQRLAAYPRHFPVEEDGRERIVLTLGGSNSFEHGIASGGAFDAQRERTQQCTQAIVCGGVVVDHQNAAFEVQVRQNRCRIGNAQRQIERKDAAAPQLGTDTDLATHQLGEIAADGQPEPGSLETPGHRAIELLERREQQWQLVFRDADARILDLEAQTDPAPIGGEGAHAQGDLAGVGELDGVIGEIDQDLADTD